MNVSTTVFDTVTLTYTWAAAGSNPSTFTYQLNDVELSSIQQSGDGSSAPSESLSLAFGKVCWTDVAPDGTTTTGNWDIETNSTS